MLYKCKICGGQLDINNNGKVTTCPYCGSIQTIPNLEDEKINRLFDRGNELIRNCQFDDAISRFEEILTLRNDDSEVYWSLLMAKFGVIYEKDPYTGNMIPTIHRNQDISIFLDEDYKLTLQYADNSQKEYYEKTARIIDNIQKKYSAISEKEEPFDIFICYKQTDDTTKQDTEDYKIAYDLYNSLTREGYRVFFSHVTLEDKIGEEYEPYIYAALKSSKVLLALGTKQEYYNAIWVKNEWSRFMYMMKNDHSKRIIPICTNTSILPLEFNKYQAIQTNNSIVWKEDLIRSIKKILAVNVQENKATISNNVQETNTTISSENINTKAKVEGEQKKIEETREEKNNTKNSKNKITGNKKKVTIICTIIALVFASLFLDTNTHNPIGMGKVDQLLANYSINGNGVEYSVTDNGGIVIIVGNNLIKKLLDYPTGYLGIGSSVAVSFTTEGGTINLESSGKLYHSYYEVRGGKAFCISPRNYDHEATYFVLVGSDDDGICRFSLSADINVQTATNGIVAATNIAY